MLQNICQFVKQIEIYIEYKVIFNKCISKIPQNDGHVTYVFLAKCRWRKLLHLSLPSLIW